MTCALDVDTGEIRRSSQTMIQAVEYYAQPSTIHPVKTLHALPSNGSAPVRETLECVKRCAQEAILAAEAMAALGRSTAARLSTVAANMDEAELSCATGF